MHDRPVHRGPRVAAPAVAERGPEISKAAGPTRTKFARIDGAAAVGDERQRQRRSADHPGDAADDHEYLQRRGSRSGRWPDYSFENESRRRAIAVLNPLSTISRQASEQAPHAAEQPKLVGDDGVGSCPSAAAGREDRRPDSSPGTLSVAWPNPRPEHALPSACANIEFATWKPCRRACCRASRWNGCSHAVDAVVDVRDAAAEAGTRRAEREQRPGVADDHERDPVRRHVQDREQRAVEHQRGADVMEQQQDHHCDRPDHKHRPEVLQRRDRSRRGSAAGCPSPSPAACRAGRRRGR